MKKQYDFSEGERGKFFKDDALFRVPIYLEPKLQQQLEEIAERRGTGVEELVSRLLEQEIDQRGNKS